MRTFIILALFIAIGGQCAFASSAYVNSQKINISGTMAIPKFDAYPYILDTNKLKTVEMKESELAVEKEYFPQFYGGLYLDGFFNIHTKVTTDELTSMIPEQPPKQVIEGGLALVEAPIEMIPLKPATFTVEATISSIGAEAYTKNEKFLIKGDYRFSQTFDYGKKVFIKSSIPFKLIDTNINNEYFITGTIYMLCTPLGCSEFNICLGDQCK